MIPKISVNCNESRFFENCILRFFLIQRRTFTILTKYAVLSTVMLPTCYDCLFFAIYDCYESSNIWINQRVVPIRPSIGEYLSVMRLISKQKQAATRSPKKTCHSTGREQQIKVRKVAVPNRRREKDWYGVVSGLGFSRDVGIGVSLLATN